MNVTQIKKILTQGEGIDVEFKESRNALPNDLFESVCAFLNGYGGNLLLGVNNNGKVVGVDPNKIGRIKTNLVNLSNNPKKLDPPFMLFPEAFEVKEKKIIYVRVPQSSQVHKTANIIFDRNEDGDFRVTNHNAISRIYQRKSAYFTENKIYPFLKFSDFNNTLFDKVRNLARIRRAAHPWLELSDEGLLKSAGLYRTDYETGKEGYTLAAALLFGKDEIIQQILPAYKTDALLQKKDKIHYDDRREIRTNLVDAYDELMFFISKHLPDKFFMEGDLSVDLREKIFREVVANILIHREYTNASPARLVIYEDRLVTENASNPVGYGPIDPENFSPNSKNPTIMKFFQQIARADELGSGIRNIRKYLPLYSEGAEFELIEGNTFKSIVKLEGKTPLATPQVTPHATMQVTMQELFNFITNNDMDKIKDFVIQKLGKGWEKKGKGLGEEGKRVGRKSKKGWEKKGKRLGENQIKLLALIFVDKNITISKASEIINISTTAIENNITRLKKRNLLKRVGTDKGGYWEVINTKK